MVPWYPLSATFGFNYFAIDFLLAFTIGSGVILLKYLLIWLRRREFFLYLRNDFGVARRFIFVTSSFTESNPLKWDMLASFTGSSIFIKWYGSTFITISTTFGLTGFYLLNVFNEFELVIFNHWIAWSNTVIFAFFKCKLRAFILSLNEAKY